MKKEKLEFSKIWLIMCAAITFMCCAVSYAWACFGFETVSDLSIALVQTLLTIDGVSFASYAMQNGIRAYSEDKFGRPYEDDDADDIEETQKVEDTPVEEN